MSFLEKYMLVLNLYLEEFLAEQEGLIGDTPTTTAQTVASRLVHIDRETPMILPPDMRDWLPENHMVKFVVEAIEELDLQKFQLNQGGLAVANIRPA